MYVSVRQTIIGSDNGLAPSSEPMLIYCYLNSGNKFQWNLSKNSNLFIQENAFENIVCEEAFISFRR